MEGWSERIPGGGDGCARVVRCEWWRHLLRTASSVEVRVKVSCEGVMGDEVELGGRSHFSGWRCAHVSDVRLGLVHVLSSHHLCSYHRQSPGFAQGDLFWI